MVWVGDDIPSWLAWSAWALMLALFASISQDVALRRRILRLRTAGLLAVLLFLWALSVDVSRGASAGVGFHLLGVTLAFLVLQARAALGLMLLLGLTFFLPEAWRHQQGLNLAANALLLVLPAWLVNVGMTKLIQHYLPKHLFVFILGRGFITAGISMLVSGLCVTLALYLTGRYSVYVLREEVLPVYVLLMWGEGFLTGLWVAVMVAFKPHWLDAYSDAVYLPAAPKQRW